MKYGMDPQEDLLKAGALPEGASWGEDPEENWGTLCLVDGGSQKVRTERGDYRLFYENVRDAMVQGFPPAVTPEQAWRTMRVLELASEAAVSGERLAGEKKRARKVYQTTAPKQPGVHITLVTLDESASRVKSYK